MEDDFHDGSWNMAMDRALFQACDEGKGGPVLRLYGWQRPTLSLGFFQDAERELDLARCRREGVPVVRRPTGGRALLHSRELTYSLVAPVGYSLFSGGLRPTHAAIARALLTGLEKLGVPGVEFGPGVKNQSPAWRKHSAACFTSLNHCEITVRGKKLVGSAQKRSRRAFLQHGSVLMEDNSETFMNLLQFPDDATRRQNLKRLRESSTCLNQVMDSDLSFRKVRKAILAGFQESFPANWEPRKINQLERKYLIRNLNEGTGLESAPSQPNPDSRNFPIR
jgi:lipoate-protein ligase A